MNSRGAVRRDPEPQPAAGGSNLSALEHAEQIMEQKWGELRNHEPAIPPDQRLAMRINDGEGHVAGYVIYDHMREPHASLIEPRLAGQSPFREIIADTQRLAPDLLNGSALSPREHQQLASILEQLASPEPDPRGYHRDPERDRRGDYDRGHDRGGPPQRDDADSQIRRDAQGRPLDSTVGGVMAGGLFRHFGIGNN